jgi:hypothetical protein
VGCDGIVEEIDMSIASASIAFDYHDHDDPCGSHGRSDGRQDSS